MGRRESVLKNILPHCHSLPRKVNGKYELKPGAAWHLVEESDFAVEESEIQEEELLCSRPHSYL